MDMIDFYANEYTEENWQMFSKCSKDVDICIDGVPQDIVNVVLNILGNDTGYNWLHAPLSKFKSKNALDLLKSPKGEKALKAFIMRLPN